MRTSLLRISAWTVSDTETNRAMMKKLREFNTLMSTFFMDAGIERGATYSQSVDFLLDFGSNTLNADNVKKYLQSVKTEEGAVMPDGQVRE